MSREPASELIRGVAAEFALDGELVGSERFAGGHINASWVVSVRRLGRTTRYLLQRINTRVLRDPEALMRNIGRVIDHVRGCVERGSDPDAERRCLRLVPTRAGGLWLSQAGDACRMYHFIESSRSRLTVAAPEDSRTAGAAFGAFQRQLTDLPGPRLLETIADFHNTPARFAALDRAVVEDRAGRRGDVRAELDFAAARRGRAGILLQLQREGLACERVVHNDAKLSNVLLDADTGAALCVVDLDTVMPGLPLFDFGDLVRSTTCTADEDEARLDRVEVEPALFDALVDGYLGATRGMLSAAERAHLVTAGMVVTLEQGVRFLTDHLCGDVYYAIAHPGHNLDRARAQFALLESIERRAAELERVVAYRGR